MGFYGLEFKKVSTKEYKQILKVVEETNYRLNGGDGSNAGLVFISGRITFVFDKRDLVLICNIRPFFHIPFFKRLFRFAFVRALKKEGIRRDPPRFLFFSELSKTLEGIL